jgi:hypothetical protein
MNAPSEVMLFNVRLEAFVGTNRTFRVYLTPQQVEDLNAEGYSVTCVDGRYFLKVHVNAKRQIKVIENQRVDISVTPFRWQVGGMTGIKAYLNMIGPSE